MTSTRLRVVQWATGPVGRHAIRAVLRHPELELVGCLVYDPAKAGVDAGELAGVGPAGVTATTDREQVLAMDADCVLYMAQGDGDPMTALADICALLGSGKNVVSTAVTSLIHPASMGAEVVVRLDEACQLGGTTFHATGIEPGWAAEVLPLAVSGLWDRVDSLLVQEIIDYASYDNAFMLFDVMGFGHRPNSTAFLAANAEILGSAFRGSVMMVAEALGGDIDRWEYHRETWPAPEQFDIAAGSIAAGHIAALRFGATAVLTSGTTLTVEHVTRLREGDAPEWPEQRGWHLTVEGSPSMSVSARVAIHDEDEADQGCQGTAMHAVHAVVPVCAAVPGVHTLADLPLILGRHTLTPMAPSPSRPPMR